MRKGRMWLAATGSLLGSAAALAAPAVEGAAPVRIAFIAYESPNQLLEDVGPVIAYLQERLGRDVQHFAATDYAGIIEALRNETADVGFMGSLQYVIAHEQAGAHPLLGELYNGSATYRSWIFVRKDSGIESIRDLAGKTIAFVDPISSSGYMYPLDVFINEGLIKSRDKAERFFKRIYFAGGDEQALRAVYNKFVDAAGVGEHSYRLLGAEEREEVVHIAESAPIPSHCVVVRAGFDRALARTLQEALLALNDGPRRSLLKSLYNVDGYVPVTHADYAEVERVARKYGFVGK